MSQHEGIFLISCWWRFLLFFFKLFSIFAARDISPPLRPPSPFAPRPNKRGHGPRQFRRAQDPLRIGPRISLFDSQKHPIAGKAGSPQGYTVKEIAIGGNIVGWLGLKKRKQLTNPLEMSFMYRQSKTFFIFGCMVLLLAALVSFFFSRHLLRPIRQLTDGARALALRKLGTKIEVRSGDELGQFAADFNTMAQPLEKYEYMCQQWIADISHELRTPLAILRGEIEALQNMELAIS